MVSLKSQEFFKKNWPDIDDERILLDQVEDRLRQMAESVWGGSKDKKEDFVKKVRIKERSYKFAGIGSVILGFLFLLESALTEGALTYGALTDLLVFSSIGILLYRAGAKYSIVLRTYIDLKTHLAASEQSVP